MMQKVRVIAEAGVNHNGSVEIAKQLVDVAAEAGADYVKFQTFKAEKIASRFAVKAEYQKENTGSAENQVAMLRKLELSEEDHNELIRHCKSKGIKFFSTPFDSDSILLLKRLGLRLGKIPSGEITNLPYLRNMAASFDEIIMSSGISDMNEVETAVNILEKAGCGREQITILHCNTQYPTPFDDVNLRAMLTIRDHFGVKVGYSDHTNGIEVAIAAVALGATVIEKHFTLDRNMDGPDHKASIEPAELIEMVQSIRNVEKALGSPEKKASPSELKNKNIARKSIVASTDIIAGEIFTEQNLTVKRPGNGISPMKWDEIIGRKAKRNFSADEMIEL